MKTFEDPNLGVMSFVPKRYIPFFKMIIQMPKQQKWMFWHAKRGQKPGAVQCFASMARRGLQQKTASKTL